MPVVDSSVIVAIVLEEGDAAGLRRYLYRSSKVTMSAMTYVETATVLARKLDKPADIVWRDLDELLQTLRIEVVDVDRLQARAAVQAIITYGKGVHRARLNIGDSFSYALAKVRGEPLLFIGDDFTHTDLASALA